MYPSKLLAISAVLMGLFSLGMALWSAHYLETECQLYQPAKNSRTVLAPSNGMVYSQEKDLWNCHGKLVYR